MSRAYRISCTESRRRHVRIDDGVQTHLELLDILPADEMAELLAAELEPLGFEREGKTMRRTDGDVAVEIDLETGAVTARLAVETEVGATVTRTRVADRAEPEPDRAALAADVSEALESKLDTEARQVAGEVAERLERALRDLGAELDPAVNRATAAALKRRAETLGQVKEVSEDPETGELTIVVEV